MNKKGKRITLALVGAAAVFSFAVIMSFGSGEKYADAIMPEDIACDEDTIQERGGGKDIDMSKKSFITLGKYGFVKEYKVKEKTVLTQRIFNDDLPSNALMYGVYKDRKLNDPVDEVDVRYNIKANTAIENGEDASKFKKHTYMVNAVLEPGTYYIAVYTKRFWDSYSLSYESQCAIAEEEIVLTEGRERVYYGSGSRRTEVRCKIMASRDGTIKVTSNYFAGLQFFDKNHQPLCDRIEPSRDVRTKGELAVSKDQIYYVKVFHPVGYEDCEIRGWIIQYEYV